LATEYVWARRLLMRAKEMAQVAADKTIRRKAARAKNEETGSALDADTG
jgi:hypothetical protein